jgi:uncharacterized protein YhaN
MDSSRVLLALEEQRKWRDRRKRLEERLEQIDRRRSYLLRELEHARRKMAEVGKLVTEPMREVRPLEPPVSMRTQLR